MTIRFRKQLSKRDVRNHLAALDALANGSTPQFEEARSVKRGPQKEGLVNKANQLWAKLKGGELRRNRQGFAEIRPGVKIPFGLGTGTLDLVGPIPIRITQAMVGRTISVYAEIESKTEEGVLKPHQQERIEHLRDMGAISGVARNAEDCEVILATWSTRP